MNFLKRARYGFTLVELVIVIVILGILSAFVIPRFGGIATDARTAALNALEGNLRSAASMAHAQQVAQSLDGDADVLMDGETVVMSRGYPAHSLSGIAKALGQYAGFSANTTISMHGLTFTLNNAPNPNTCYVRYYGPDTLGHLPIFVTSTSGCA